MPIVNLYLSEAEYTKILTRAIKEKTTVKELLKKAVQDLIEGEGA